MSDLIVRARPKVSDCIIEASNGIEAMINYYPSSVLNSVQAERCAELLKQIMIAVKEDASVELVITPKQSFYEAAEKRAMEVGRQMSESVAGLLTGTGSDAKGYEEYDEYIRRINADDHMLEGIKQHPAHQQSKQLDKKEIFYACLEVAKMDGKHSPKSAYYFTKELQDLCYGKDEK